MQAEVTEQSMERLMGQEMGTWLRPRVVPRPVWAADRAFVRAQRPTRESETSKRKSVRGLKEPIRKNLPQT